MLVSAAALVLLTGTLALLLLGSLSMSCLRVFDKQGCLQVQQLVQQLGHPEDVKRMELERLAFM